jgi:hypothetical protein
MMEAPVAAPDELRQAVASLSIHSGHTFAISERPVPGTTLYVVYATDHPLPKHYTRERATLGFRVPDNWPDAAPEDSFFLFPGDIKLSAPDPVRNTIDINRAAANSEHIQGVMDGPALVFSWHLWNKVAWNRRKHTLVDHYSHCLRRFEQIEHD